jgi:hypothetical protein
LFTTFEESPRPQVLWKLHYEEQCSERPASRIEDSSIIFSHPSADLAFDDETLEQVQMAWSAIVEGEEGDGFLRFPAWQEPDVDDVEDGVKDL